MPNKLYTTRNDVVNRFSDIKIMSNILEKEEKVNSQLLIKSSIILMLYNAIEGTFNNILSELFDYIAQNQISLDNLPERLKKLILKFHLNNIKNNIKELDRFRKTDGIKLCYVDYYKLKKQLNLFSGNLDASSIRKISNDLGVDLPKDLTSNYLLKIKKIRNELAHGEITYLKASNDITTKELLDICNDVYDYLERLIYNYEKFFERL